MLRQTLKYTIFILGLISITAPLEFFLPADWLSNDGYDRFVYIIVIPLVGGFLTVVLSLFADEEINRDRLFIFGKYFGIIALVGSLLFIIFMITSGAGLLPGP